MKINVGSGNPVKIKAVKDAFSNYFDSPEVVSIKVDSGVHEQPKSLKEIITGAKNRAVAAFKGCDFSVGLEAGIFPFPDVKTGYVDTSAAVIFDGKDFFIGTSPCFEYPKSVIEAVLKGKKDVGAVFDEIYGTNNLKHKEGAVGILTKNIVPRDKLIELSIVMALCRIVSKEHYEK
ncbi:inosine/xanthosine triphosphatase [Candidatus Woesearchaeota archaeon]|nr:inosine/xanthosine triphosphatase [Candidatus Woesearchaeota archaeon]